MASQRSAALVCFREICNVLRPSQSFFSSLIPFFPIRRTFRRRKKSRLPPSRPPSHRVFLGLGLGSRSPSSESASVGVVSGFRTLSFPLLIICNEKGNAAASRRVALDLWHPLRLQTTSARWRSRLSNVTKKNPLPTREQFSGRCCYIL